MEFESANPSVIRSVKQRDLLNAWLRVLGKDQSLPSIGNYRPDRIADELADLMRYDVIGDSDNARFRVIHEGSRISATYGNEPIDSEGNPNRYLDEAIDPAIYARVMPSYQVCLARKRPTYSISAVSDADGKDVSFERLLLPFGSADSVEQIIGSYKAISIEGGFKIANLLGVRSRAVPVNVINAVIDHDFVQHLPCAQGSALDRGPGDVIELN